MGQPTPHLSPGRGRAEYLQPCNRGTTQRCHTYEGCCARVGGKLGRTAPHSAARVPRGAVSAGHCAAAPAAFQQPGPRRLRRRRAVEPSGKDPGRCRAQCAPRRLAPLEHRSSGPCTELCSCPCYQLSFPDCSSSESRSCSYSQRGPSHCTFLCENLCVCVVPRV